MIEMELYEVRTIYSNQFGTRLPTSSSLYWLSSLFNNDPSKVDTGGTARSFGGGDSMFGLTLGSATTTATALKSYGKTLQKTFVQALNGQPAQLLLGEKYPVLTAGYFGDTGAGSGTSEELFRPPPSFQFENLGLAIKVTPFVHGEEEMSLEVEAEFKLLTGAEINGIPVLANRKFTSRVRLKNDEWAVIGGLNQDTESINKSGIPGLMHVPILGAALRTNNIESDNTSMLLVMRPRLLGLSPVSTATSAIFLGTESRPAMPF
jgi:type II secretory pathway component GspD/PulD (secretin)